jgi:hypothetical protein
MTNGNSSAIFDSTLEYAMSIYIGADESRDELLKKFEGDKVKLVQWLRERAFSKDAPIKNTTPVPTEAKKEIPASLIPKIKRKKKEKSESDSKKQNSIF